MATQTVLPDAVLANSEISGTLTDYTSQDGTWAAATGGGASDVRLSFAALSPSGNLTTGANLQTFNVHVRKDASGGNNVDYDIEVWEGGTDLTNRTSHTGLSSTTGVTQSHTWDASILTSGDGSNVEIRVVQTGGHTGGPPGDRRYLEIDYIEWVADYGTTITGSGSVTPSAPTLSAGGKITKTGIGDLTPSAPTLTAAGTVTGYGLPTTVSGTDFPDTPGNMGPWLSGGNVYFLSRSAQDVQVFKATDPTSGFTEQDSADRPSLGSTVRAIDGEQDGTDLHVLCRASTNGEVFYAKFSMSSDTWTIDDTTKESVDTTDSGEQFVQVIPRSDGTVVAVYDGDDETINASPYSRVRCAIRSTGGTWGSVGTLVSGNTTTEDDELLTYAHHTDDTNDRIHIFWHVNTARDLNFSTLLSNDTFGHQDTQIDADTQFPDEPIINGVTRDNGGTIEVRVPYHDDSLLISVVEFDDADNPTVNINADINDFRPNDNGGTIVNDSGTLRLLYVKRDDNDIYSNNTGANNDTWQANDTEQRDAITATYIHANLYTRTSSTKQAFIYENGSGLIVYDEIDLGGADVTGAADVTAGAATVSATGEITNTGTADVTPDQPTTTASGTITKTGSANVTAGSPTTTATGEITKTGSASVTADAPTVSASGTITKTGSASVTPASPTTTASGKITKTGSASVTPGQPTTTAVAERIITGAGDATADSPTLDGQGSISGTVSGTADVTAGAPTLDGSGSVQGTITGTGDATADSPTVSATGERIITGTASMTAGAATASASGTTSGAPDTGFMSSVGKVVRRVVQEALEGATGRKD